MEQQSTHTEGHFVEFDPQRELISSERVQGTTVYCRDGTDLGEIHSLLINKQTGQVSIALLEHGGFLGFNESYFPVPWQALDYDVDREGYATNLTRQELENAPRLKLDEDGRPMQWNAEEIEGYYTNLDWWGL